MRDVAAFLGCLAFIVLISPLLLLVSLIGELDAAPEDSYGWQDW